MKPSRNVSTPTLLCATLLAMAVLLMGQAPAMGAEDLAPGIRPNPRIQQIKAKLNTLRFASVQFHGMPLSEVLQFLTTEVKRLNVAERELRFILRVQQAESEGLENVKVNIALPLTNVRLIDVLDAIVMAANKPIKYSVEDYGVVFSFRKTQVPPLFTRILRVDPAALQSALQAAGGIRELLASFNIDLSPPKNIYVKDREGIVIVRATLQDLDEIENALQSLKAPSQPNKNPEKPPTAGMVPEIWHPTDPPRKAR